MDGNLAGSSTGFKFTNNSDNSEIKGLVINNFSGSDAIRLLADDIKVQGNYIGTNPTGAIAKPNNVGVNAHTQDINSGKNALIGGLNPADRNLISGNTAGSTGTAGYPGTGWVIQGNYVGVGADGLTPIANSTNGGSGVLSIDDCNDVIVGGSQAGAINVIGESLGHGIAPHNVQNLTIEGNYIGLGYDGNTVLGNITGLSSGSGITLSDSTDIAIRNNRVSGWKTDGVSVNNGNADVVVDGNVVFTIQTNGISVGISTNVDIVSNNISSSQNGIATFSNIDADIIGNTVTNNSQQGIYLNQSNQATIDSNVIQDNTLNGVNIDTSDDTTVIGNTVTNNSQQGIFVGDSSSTTIGGGSPTERNIIYNNAVNNIYLVGFSGTVTNTRIQGNYIGVDSSGLLNNSYIQGPGIALAGAVSGTVVGGSNTDQGNIIMGNSAAGILVAQITIAGFGSLSANQNTILNNHIYSNKPGNSYGLSLPGLGIEHIEIQLDGSFTPQSAVSSGPTLNDTGDTDTGPNNYMNFPVINNVDQNLLNLSVSFDLDALDSPTNQYRVEFFANDTADPSGYGEGQTYLGSATVSPGTNQTANITLPTGTNLTGKVLSATTTAIDGGTTSGFGSTSEFSLTKAITVSALPKVDSSLANTGQNIRLSGISSGVVIIIAYVSYRTRRYIYSARR